MSLKVSQLDSLTSVDGSEYLLVVSNSESRRITLDLVKSILNKNDVGLGNVDDTADIDKPISQLVSLALNGKANVIHNHSISDITGLQTALDSILPAAHTHTTSDITDFVPAVTTLIANTTSPSDVEVGLLEW